MISTTTHRLYPRLIYGLVLWILAGQLHAQGHDSLSVNTSPRWNDTNYIRVTLPARLNDPRIVRINLGEKALLYFSATAFVNQAKTLSNDYNKKELSLLIRKTERSKKGTLTLDGDLPFTEHVVSALLQHGEALVYYKKEKQVVPLLMHRLEKYGMYAYRFFYLPDRRAFYSVMEYSGIIEHNTYFSNPKELRQAGEKLGTLYKE